jgi:5,10-methylenetetrahydrofolate reductase
MWIYTTAGVTSTKYDMVIDKELFSSLNQTIERVSLLPEVKAWTNIEDIKADLSLFEKKFEAGKNVVITMKVVQFFNDGNKKEVLQLDQKTKDILKKSTTGVLTGLAS